MGLHQNANDLFAQRSAPEIYLAVLGVHTFPFGRRFETIYVRVSIPYAPSGYDYHVTRWCHAGAHNAHVEREQTAFEWC